MKNIYCVVGPSGSGKTTLVKALEEKYGYKVAKTCTTRPPRFEGEDSYHFVTPEEFKALGPMFAYCQYDGNEYGLPASEIEQHDLFVLEPSGVEDVMNRYCGEKGVRVFGLSPDADVLVERMRGRGDSYDKIVRRLAFDAESFKDLNSLADGVYVGEHPLDELCASVHSWIEDYEDRARHEFSLLNQYGDVVGSKRCDSLEDALAGINKSYPEGLPEGWTVRDDTALLRDTYVKAIKKCNPKFKTSHIYIVPTHSDYIYQGHVMVPFKYGDKRYSYCEDVYGNAWIKENVRAVFEKSGADILAEKIDFLYKKTAMINKELEQEYTDGETDWAAQLEVSLERLELATYYFEKALAYTKQQAIKPPLDDVIGKSTPQEKPSGDWKPSTVIKNER